MLQLWSVERKNSDDEIIKAWLQAGETDEAIAFARSIQSGPEHASTDLVLAQQMLDQAGAPNI